MNRKHKLKSISYSIAALLLTPSYVRAEVITDGTTPTLAPNNCSANNCEIQGGTQRGNNLFHSFTKFNISEGQRVIFRDYGVTNIFSRVTGNEQSNINGEIGVLGNANLFLINPNGITFGNNASLALNGSFVATTANAIEFGDRGIFSTKDLSTPALLVVNPSAFIFDRNTGEITNQSVGLQVVNDRSLLLLGGNVSLNKAFLTALNGRIELGAVAGTGKVGLLNHNDQNFSLSFPENLARAEVSLRESAINVIGEGKGSIAISAQNINIFGSEIRAGVGIGKNSSINLSGNITLNATGVITSRGQASQISNQLRFSSIGNAGDIILQANSVFLDDGIEINTSALGQGNAGSVFIQADNLVTLTAGAKILSSNIESAGGAGDAGDIQIRTGSLVIDNASLLSSSFGLGNAGEIIIQATNDVSLQHSILSSTAGIDSQGGDINIQADTLSLTEGTMLFTNTNEGKQAGNVIINTTNSVFLSNSAIFSNTFGVGNGGNTYIKTGTLTLNDGAKISVTTTGSGNAGNIQIFADNLLSISGINPNALELLEPIQNTTSSGLFATTEAGATGKGGNIAISAGTLQVSDGAVISALTRSRGGGGSIAINASNVELAGGGQILASAYSSGNAGNIGVTANKRIRISGINPNNSRDNDGLNSGLLVGVTGDRLANAGEIAIASPLILVDNGGTIAAETKLGTGGNINLDSGSIQLRNNSRITATAGGISNGGNIDIDTDTLVLDRSKILAEAVEGRGGTIDINTQGLFSSAANNISANSQRGTDGEVKINRAESEPEKALSQLPVEPVDITGLIAQSCAAGGGTLTKNPANSELIIAGRGGLPPTPIESLRSELALVDLGKPVASNDKSNRVAVTTTKQPKAIAIVEAQGWIIAPEGQIILTASAPNVTPEVPWLNSPSCHNS